MPPVVVLILCRVISHGSPDPMTNWMDLEWDTRNAMMICRRQEVQMTDPAADQGATPQSFNEQRCRQSAMTLGSTWDAQHQNSNYRFWKAACPSRIINDITGETIGWQIPSCGHADTVICESDSAI